MLIQNWPHENGGVLLYKIFETKSTFRFWILLSSIQVYYSERHHMMHHYAFWHFWPEIQIYKKFFKKTNNSDAERG